MKIGVLFISSQYPVSGDPERWPACIYPKYEIIIPHISELQD